MSLSQPEATAEIPAIELAGIAKFFGPIIANDEVDLRVQRGSVHAIVGENGAGKSTLMNILYGLYRPDSGDIRINGNPCRFDSPADAHRVGLGMVHQHFMLVDCFTVLENIMLGFEGGRVLAGPAAAATRALDDIERDYGLSVPLDRLVEDLPVGMRQRVEILKALYRGADVLILDEPTGVLTPGEADQLFRIIERLKKGGKTVLFISHKLGEVMRIADRVSVMRRGRMVAERDIGQTSASDLAELMIGEKLGKPVARADKSPGRPVLHLDGISAPPVGHGSGLDDIHFSVREGEIVGIAGVTGNGQSELLELLAGLRAPTGGRVEISGDIVIDPDAQAASAALRQRHAGLVAEDRLRSGAVAEMTAAENAILGYHAEGSFSRRGLLDRPAIRRTCERIMRVNDVRPPNPDLPLAKFSGGNQQKLVIGRETEHEPRLFILGEPTRGVDIGAVQRIHNNLISMRNSGAAILVVSSDLDELLAIADRILVMFAGRVVGEVAAEDADIGALGMMMAGERQGDATSKPGVRQ